MKGYKKFFCVVAVAAVAVLGMQNNAFAAPSNQSGILNTALQDMFSAPELVYEAKISLKKLGLSRYARAMIERGDLTAFSNLLALIMGHTRVGIGGSPMLSAAAVSGTTTPFQSPAAEKNDKTATGSTSDQL